MPPVLFAMPGNEPAAQALGDALDAHVGKVEIRSFPDEETYVRVLDDVAEAETAIVCTLDRPNAKLPGLFFLARALKDLGARRVGLIAPYLAYMRQDTRFHAGEAVTSAYFAEWLSSFVDWLATVDPHLHRHADLGELYAIPAASAHTAPLLAEWIREHVSEPVIIGPDSESEQWVASVAREAGARCTVLEKTRRGDRSVEVSVPDIDGWAGRTPVLVDDIISTGHTMLETMRHLAQTDAKPPVCLGIHAVFAGDALAELRSAGAAQIVTCNTIPHETNAIDVLPLLAETVAAM